MPKEIAEAIEAAVIEQDGRRKLTCAEAFKLSQSLKISPAEIGQYCNDNEIKISACQLGCF